MNYFYSRPCGRGDQRRTKRPWKSSWPFLLTPLREGRHFTLRSCAVRSKFLLTPLREGRHHRPHQARKQQHFYSRPCGRGDQALRCCAKGLGHISTHAPAGGATSMGAYNITQELDISTHAPAGGATSATSLFRPWQRRISTHAPAGGAT